MLRKGKTYVEVPSKGFYEKDHYIILDHGDVSNVCCRNRSFILEDSMQGILKVPYDDLPEEPTTYFIDYDYTFSKEDLKKITDEYYENLCCPKGEMRLEAEGEEMFENILNKHVTVFRKDGNVLMGFLLEVKDGFVRMIEQDNKVIIFNIDCVDLIREGLTDFSEKVEEKVERQVVLPQARKVSRREPKEYEFLDDENPNYDEKSISSCPDEFSMSVKRLDEDPKYRAPSFIRTTEKEE